MRVSTRICDGMKILFIPKCYWHAYLVDVASPNNQCYFQKGSHTAGNQYSFPLMHHLLVRNILVELKREWVRGVSRNGKYEDVQIVFCISCDSDAALHTALRCIPCSHALSWIRTCVRAAWTTLSLSKSWSVSNLLFSCFLYLLFQQKTWNWVGFLPWITPCNLHASHWFTHPHPSAAV